MNNQRERILNLVKKNIVTKITYGKKLVDDYDKKLSLLKELERNKSLFLKSDKNEAEAKEKKEFVMDIVRQLGWSMEIANDVLKSQQYPIVRTRKISKTKMKEFSASYENQESKINKEANKILMDDSITGKYSVLHSRLREIHTAKGASWGKEEIKFVVEKREQGYSFQAIAQILKRPVRVVRMKYHENK